VRQDTLIDESMLQTSRIPAGEFIMGSDEGDDDERPLHKAYLDEFWIGTRPVTNAEYAHFVRETGHAPPRIAALPLMISTALEEEFRTLAGPYVWPLPQGKEQHPVTLVGFDDALAYCAWLSSKTGRRIRLPSEAEWEKAARGGLQGKRYPWGDEFNSGAAHFLPHGAEKAGHGTAAVGNYPPNAFQLFDMAGNVWEWVSDWYVSNYYARAHYLNPQGPETGLMRLVRGGSWVNGDEHYLRCAYRHKVPPDTYGYSIGFRIAYSA